MENLQEGEHPSDVPKDKTALIFALSGAFTSVFNNFIKWASLVLIAYFSYLSINSLSGKETITNIAVKVLANLQIQNTVSYGVGIAGVGYGYYQRRLRKKRIAELAAHSKNLEILLDNKRTSSGISKHGTTEDHESI